MPDRAFRVTSPDGHTWEISTPVGAAGATVVRWERAPGETAARAWTKRMSRWEATQRAIRHIQVDGWRFTRE